MQKSGLTLLIISLTVLLFSCRSEHVDYMGKSLSPTKSAKIYSNKSEVSKNYKVIGKAIVTAPSRYSSKRIHKKILKVAEKNGADGVIVVDYKQKPKGSHESMNRPMPMAGPMAGGTMPMYGGGAAYNSGFGGPMMGMGGYGMYPAGGASTYYYYEIYMKTLFIEFKENKNSSKSKTKDEK